MKKNVQELGNVSKLTLGSSTGQLMEFTRPNGENIFSYQSAPPAPNYPSKTECNCFDEYFEEC